MMRLDVQDLGCDMYTSSPHKWLQAPKGTGLPLRARRGDGPALEHHRHRAAGTSPSCGGAVPAYRLLERARPLGPARGHRAGGDDRPRPHREADRCRGALAAAAGFIITYCSRPAAVGAGSRHARLRERPRHHGPCHPTRPRCLRGDERRATPSGRSPDGPGERRSDPAPVRVARGRRVARPTGARHELLHRAPRKPDPSHRRRRVGADRGRSGDRVDDGGAAQRVARPVAGVCRRAAPDDRTDRRHARPGSDGTAATLRRPGHRRRDERPPSAR